MEIQNSHDFSTKVISWNPQTTTTNMMTDSVFVHGIIVSCVVQYDKTLTDWLFG